jgi:flavin reductase (DIM6/NTAB) family NADH-FMN oxidoreductase RutF
MGGRAMKRSLGAKTLLYPTPVCVVGTYDHAGEPNAIDSSLGRYLLFQPAIYSRLPS